MDLAKPDFRGHQYARIIKDPTFEKRLATFDPDLRLLFDQTDKKFKILQWDKDSWNILLTLEADEEVGDWIFNILWAWRKEAELRNKDVDRWFMGKLSEADADMDRIEEKIHDNHRHLLADERNEWRRASRELKNQPKSDVTAGYPKVAHKPKHGPHRVIRNGELYAPNGKSIQSNT